MQVNNRQHFLNIVAKNRARALFGQPPIQTTLPSFDLNADFVEWFSEEFRQCAARAHVTRSRLSPHHAALDLGNNLPMHLQQGWDGAQPEHDIVDLISQQEKNAALPPDSVVGFQWQPSLRLATQEPRDSSSTTGDGDNSKERAKQAGYTQACNTFATSKNDSATEADCPTTSTTSDDMVSTNKRSIVQSPNNALATRDSGVESPVYANTTGCRTVTVELSIDCWLPKVLPSSASWPSLVERLPINHAMHDVVVQLGDAFNMGHPELVGFPRDDGFFRLLKGEIIAFYNEDGKIFVLRGEVHADNAPIS